MRVLLISLFIGAVCTAPQGYDYQVQVGSGGNNDFTLEQYQLLQQYAQQQQQQQQLEQQLLQQQLQLQYQQQQPLQQPQQSIAIQESTPEVAAILSQTLTQTENGGYQFANQLVQQAQQLVQYEQQDQPQPQQHQQQQQQQQHQQQQQVQQTDTVLSKEGYETAVPEVHTQTEQVLPQVPEVVQQPPLHEEPQSHAQANLQVPEAQVEAKHQQHHHHQQHQQQIQYSQPPAVPQPQLQPQPHYQPTHHQQQSVQYNKEFFYLTAPQDDFDQSQNVQNQLDQIKKNIRVVFIKAPEQNGLTNAALQLAKQSQDAQTAIYVLTKQHDVNDLANKLQQIRGGGQSKPEVTFIKYKTPAEAEHAQRTIQAQYEALNGPNHFNHEGVSPTHSFIGSTGVDPRKSSSTHASAAAAGEDVAATPAAKYLPSAAKH